MKIRLNGYDYIDYTDYIEVIDQQGHTLGYITEPCFDKIKSGHDPIDEAWEDGNGNTLTAEGWGDWYVPTTFRKIPHFWELLDDTNAQLENPYTPAELAARLLDLMDDVPELTPEEAISAAYDELQWI